MQEKKKNDRGSSKKKSFSESKKKQNEIVSVRKHIYDCLCHIYIDQSYSNIDLDHMIRENKMSDADRRLFTNVVYGTLQHERQLNWELQQLTEKTPKFNIKILIWMSLYQLRFLDKVPPFAIIHEAVDLAKQAEGEFTGKFVNAVLREATRTLRKPQVTDFKSEEEYWSVLYNMPIWVIKMWLRFYDKETTLLLLKSCNEKAPLACRVNTSLTCMDEILKDEQFTKGNLARDAVIYHGNLPVMETSFFKERKISIQDESSQFVGEILNPAFSDHVLDLCAAPGSKTACIAQLMQNQGKILALDIHEHRIQLMKNYLAQLQLTNTTCICYDSTRISEKTKLLASFDKVLLDAPCSGLGVVRRKPDILLGLTGKQIDELISLQAKLLQEAYKMVKSGGILVYSTCTIHKRENESQITEFLSKHKDMKRVFEKQIFPFEYNSDGFYICKMVKE